MEQSSRQAWTCWHHPHPPTPTPLIWRISNIDEHDWWKESPAVSLCSDRCGGTNLMCEGVKRTARSCVSDLQLKCSCFHWGDRQMLHEWVIVALLPGLFRGPRGIYHQSCGSASKLCQNILALGQDVLSPEKSQLFIDFLLMSETELGWLMWKQHPNESQIPGECSSVTGWFLQLRGVCQHHNGVKVVSMTALKRLQHWGCGSWLICDWLWLPP